MKNMIRNTALLVFLLISAPVLALESSIRGIMFMDALNENNMVVAENLGEGKYRIIHLELVDGNLVVKSAQTVITHEKVKGSPEWPLTADEQRAKFMGCARMAAHSLDRARLAEALAALEAIEDQPNILALPGMLTAQAAMV